MPDVLAILASQGANSSQHAPVGNPEHIVVPTPVTNQQMIASGGSAGLNGVEQPPVSLANEAGDNSQSFEQPCMQDVLDILASLEKQGATSSQHTPVGSTQQNVVPTPVTNQQMIASGGSAGVNVVEQPPASWLQTPPVISQRRAGKRPVNTDSDSILRKSPAPSSHPSNLHLPVTMQSPMQVTGGPSNDVVAERSDQIDPNRLGQSSAYPPPGLQAVLDSDKGLLKEWWELFWPQFSFRLANETGENSQSFEKPSMQDVLAILASQGATSSQHAPVGNPEHVVVPTPVTNQQMIASGGSAGLNGMEQSPVSLANEAGGNSQSFGQPCMQDVLDILASLEKQGATSSQHTPVGSTQQNVVPTPVTNQQMIASGGSAGVNVVEQPPASWLQTPPVISQHRAGKRPVNTDSDSILRKYPAPSSHPSNLHLPVTMQSPVQVTGGTSNNAVAERSDQMDSNRLGQNSASPPPGLQADLSEFLSDFLKE